MTPVLQGGREGSRSGSGKSHSRHSGSSFRDLLWELRGERCTQGGLVGVSRRGPGAGDECWRNAPGMLDGAFLEEACSTRADVASGEITGSSFHRCLPFSFQHTHAHRT